MKSTKIANGQLSIVKYVSKVWGYLFKRGRPFKLTKGGWVFILYTIGVGAGAINTGNNLLYLIFGLFLGIILASGFLSDISLWDMECHVEFPESGQAQKASFIGFNIHNRKKWFPGISVTVELIGTLRGEEVHLHSFIPALYPGESLTKQFIFIPSQRGWFQMTALRVSTHFPFGLLNKWWNQAQIRNAEFKVRKEKHNITPPIAHPTSSLGMVIYPQIRELTRTTLAASVEGKERTATQTKRGEGVHISSLRDYQDSDNPKKIHWKASAKRTSNSTTSDTRWVIKETEIDDNEDVILKWPSMSRFKSMSSAEFETMIDFTASLIDQLRKEEGYLGKLMVPRSTGANQEELWEIRSSTKEEAEKNTMEFLALIDPKASMDDWIDNTLCPIDGTQLKAHHRTIVDVSSLFKKWLEQQEVNKTPHA